MPGFFDTPIEYLKGVGPQRAALLNKELGIFTFGDLLQHYPFRYEDRTRFYSIGELTDDLPNVQVKGRIRSFEMVGDQRKKRLKAVFVDATGTMDLVWFKGIQWITQKFTPGVDYVIYGKPATYGARISMAHPEIEPLTIHNASTAYWLPVYSVTEKLRAKYIDSRALSKVMLDLVRQALPHITETLPQGLLASYGLVGKDLAIQEIHFPSTTEALQKARFRLKFEELFYVQLRMIRLKLTRIEKYRGAVLSDTSLLTQFYNDHLPFPLTEAQKRVIKEIYADMKSGKQMNRLLQGDVGSGKTIVAFICALIAIGSGRQVALMAPTEILAQQHFQGLKPFAEAMGLEIRQLTGSSKSAARRSLHEGLRAGTVHLLVGTHALLEEEVQFHNLGLAIVDEQHRFGVAQRSRLWQKNPQLFPHVLVMTATPIPRTLAMTLYGDLDVSVIDELPAGRKPIKTLHRYDSNRLQVFGFIKEQIAAGRQVYVVYPLIEESEKLDLKDLTDGYDSICRAFPHIPVSIVHGKMKAAVKEFEMQRFVKAETKIMVATTVIEVGVNVPNASVMVIENAERFGLAQLHQLRGRVGRGADQSYCVLMTSVKLSKEARVRINTMVRTNNGFEIADTDLELRGPGDLLGTQQSGILDLLIADLAQDGQIVQAARQAAQEVLDHDPELKHPANKAIRTQLAHLPNTAVNWSRIS
jgi:ATP-dependent DNA helicase RecG